MSKKQYGIQLDIDPNEMDIDLDEPSNRFKQEAILKKGRGFQDTSDSNREEIKMDRFDTLDKDISGKAVKSIDGWVLIVTCLHEEAREEDILDKFSDFGKVKSVHLNLDRQTGYCKGYAFIEYETIEEAHLAIEERNSMELLGEPVQCAFAFVRGPDSSNHRHGDRRR